MLLNKAKFIILSLFSLFICLKANFGFCLPEIEKIDNGSANINYPNERTMEITAIDKTIINYSSFNINNNESVLINLPSNSSSILNRVTGGSRSEILGKLQSNGIVILVNEAGIHLGQAAEISASGLILSTRNIDNQDFINSKYQFERLSKKQLDMLLLNEGSITINNAGFGVFIAGAIENKGTIVAPLGKIVLAGADAVKLDISGNGLISVAIDAKTASTIYDYDGKPITEQIKNSGRLEACGGHVILKAESLTDIFSKTINLSGIVRANRWQERDGKIYIIADKKITLSADLEATNIILGQDSIIPEEIDIIGAELFAETLIDINANGNITISSEITSQGGDINILADADNNGSGSFYQKSGIIETQGNGNITINGSGNMQLQTVATEDGAIKIGNLRMPKAITGQPHFIHRDGDFIITKKTVTDNIGKIETSRGDILLYDTNSSLNLETNSGLIRDLDLNNALNCSTLNITGKGFFINTLANYLTLHKDTGDLYISESITSASQSTILAEDVQVTYLTTSDITLNSCATIDTLPGVILSARNLTLIAQQFGTYSKPIVLNASNLHIQRSSGEINILESKGIGTSILIAGPPENNWGAIKYNYGANLFLQAEKISLIGNSPTYLYGNITFSNLECLVPDKYIYFEKEMTYAILGDWLFRGSYGKHIHLQSSQKGIQWKVNPQANYDLSYIWVEDAYNISPKELILVESSNRGNCANWDPIATWSNGGGDGLWSNPDNWAGLGGLTTPGAGDDVVFNGTSNTASNIDAIFSIGSLSLNAGYNSTITVNNTLTITTSSGRDGSCTINSGTLSFAGTNGINIEGPYSQTAGSFTCLDGDLNFYNTFSLTGGSFTASSLYTTIYNTFSISGAPTFNANSGTIIFTENSCNITSGSVSFNNVIFSPYSSQTKSLLDDFTIIGNLTMSAEGTVIGSGANRTITLSGNFEQSLGTFGPTFLTLTFSGAALQSINLVGGTFTPNMIVNKTGSYLYPANIITLPTTAALSVINGTFNIGAYIITINCSYTQSGGNLTVAGGTFTVNGDFVQSNGVIDQIEFSGDNANINQSGGSITGNVTFSPSSGQTKTLTSDLSIAGDLTISGEGNISSDGSSRTITLQGNFLQSYGTFGDSGLSLSCTGGNTQTFTQTDGTFSPVNFEIDKSGNGVALASAFTFNCSGSFILTNGEFSITPTSTICIINCNYSQTSGTVSLADGSSINFSGNNSNISQTGGTFTGDVIFSPSAGQTKTLTSDLSIVGCIDMSGAGSVIGSGINRTITMTGNFYSQSAGTFGPTLLTLLFSGTQEQYITVSGGTFTPAVRVNKTGGILFANGDLTIPTTGSFTMEAGTFRDYNGGTRTINGSFTQTGGIIITVWNNLMANGNFSQSGGSLDYVEFSGNDANISQTGGTLENITFSPSAGQTKTLITDISNTGYIDMNGEGTVIGSGSNRTISLEGNFNQYNGTFGPTFLTLNFSGNSTQGISISGGTFSANLTVNKTSNTFTFSTDFTLDSTANTFTLTQGTVNDFGGTTVTINGNYSQSAGALAFTSSPIIVKGNFSQSGGTITTINFSGNDANISQTAGSIETITFSPSAGQTKTLTSNLSLTGNLTLDGAGTLATDGYDLTISSTLNLYTGTLNATNGSGGNTIITLGADWYKDAAANFTNTNSTVIFNNSGLTSTISGENTFNNFTCETASKALIFAGSSTQTIAGTLTLNGQASGTEITLRSASPGTRFTLDVTAGPQSVYYVDVQDSQTSSNNITAYYSIDSGNNDNNDPAPHWVFNIETYTFSGLVYSDDGTTLIGAGKTIALVMDGTVQSTTTTDASSQYSFTVSIVSNPTVLVYIVGDAIQANTITIATYANIANLNIYGSRVIVRHETTGPVTNAWLSTAKGSLIDSDIIYSVSGSTLTLNDNIGLLVWTGKTYTPDGHINTADLIINSSATLNGGGYTITLTGNWTNSGTFSAGISTVNFSTTSTAAITGDTTFYNLSCTVPDKNLNFAVTSTQTINGSLTLTGTSSQKIVLNSSDNVQRFTLIVASAQTVNYVSVANSQVGGTSGNDIIAMDSTNNGNTDVNDPSPHWIFRTSSTNNNNLTNVLENNTTNTPKSNNPFEDVVEQKDTSANSKTITADKSFHLTDVLVFNCDCLSSPMKYGRCYIPGKYRTTVILFEGRVTWGPYNDKGLLPDSKNFLIPGQKSSMEDIIK